MIIVKRPMERRCISINGLNKNPVRKAKNIAAPKISVVIDGTLERIWLFLVISKSKCDIIPAP